MGRTVRDKEGGGERGREGERAYLHVPLLPNPVTTGLGLNVILGIPVRVKNDHCIS